MIQNLSIDQEDFETMPIFMRDGGWGVVRRTYGIDYADYLEQVTYSGWEFDRRGGVDQWAPGSISLPAF